MPKIIYCLLAVLCICSANAQEAPGSINAFYDALFLSGIKKGSNDTTSLRALKILSAYHRGINGKPSEFESNMLTEKYAIALSNIFKVNVVKHYFDTTRTPNPTTKILRDMVEKMKADSTKLSAAQQQKARYQIINVAGYANYLRQIRADTNMANNLKDSLVNLFPNDSVFIDSLNTNSFLVRENVLLLDSVLGEIKQKVVQRFTDTISIYTVRISKTAEQISDFVINNFSELDKDLRNKIASTTEGQTQLQNYDKMVQNFAYTTSNTSSALAYQNETYSLSNFKIPSQTELIDALAIYLAKRFKQEVALTLVEQFRKILKNDQLILDLFPETYKMFNSGKVYELPSFGSAWNYAISKDFNNLLPNLTHSGYIQHKIGDSLLVGYLQDVVDMCSLINKQFNMVDVVSFMYNRRFHNEFFFKNITTLQIINKELFDTTSTARYWVSSEQLYAVSQQQFDLFYELVNEKYGGKTGAIGLLENFTYSGLDSMRNLLSSTLVLLNNFQTQQRRYLQSQNSNIGSQLTDYWSFLNQLFEVLNTAIPQKSKTFVSKYISISTNCLDTYGLIAQKNYAGAALRMMDIFPAIKDNNYVDVAALILNTDKINRISLLTEQEAVKKLEEACGHYSTMLKEYYFKKRYAEEIINLKNGDKRYLLSDPRTAYFKKSSININFNVNDLISALNKDTTNLRKALNEQLSNIAALLKDKKIRAFSKPKAELLLQTLVTSYNDPQLQEYISNASNGKFDAFRKLTSFLSDILLAGDSRNLSRVIEKYALPPNSYQIKRSSRQSWDLNAYVGAYIGAETITSNNKTSVAGVYGFSVPVGVSYSWAKIDHNRKGLIPFLQSKQMAALRGNAWTLTVSLIDIGAVVSYRLGNTNEGLPRKVTWAQLLSPGVAIRSGIRDTPICVSLGIQRTPQLRNINTNNDLASANRVYAGFFFDLPLYNISHR